VCYRALHAPSNYKQLYSEGYDPPEQPAWELGKGESYPPPSGVPIGTNAPPPKKKTTNNSATISSRSYRISNSSSQAIGMK
jgi:hypothetical protein